MPLWLFRGEEREVGPELAEVLFHYFELCEEELYYRMKRRISAATWVDWSEGLAVMLSRPQIRQQLEDELRHSKLSPPHGEGLVRLQRFTLLGVALAERDRHQDRFYDPVRPTFLNRWSRLRHRLHVRVAQS